MAIITFSIVVDDVESISTIFDKIQVWRSLDKDGAPNPYIEITANAPTAARIDGSLSGPWNLNTQQLTIELDMAPPLTVTFSGANPIELEDVIEQINAVFPGLASEVPTDTGKIRLTSPVIGTQSVILASGAAAGTLGISTSRTNGKGARSLISSATDTYEFKDYDGLPNYWYKTRYYNSETGALSALSEPIFGGDGTAIESLAVTGTIRLADMTGKPVPGIRIIFVPVTSQTFNDGVGLTYGIFQSVNRIEVLTDINGMASIDLIPEQTLKVFIEGTNFQRQFIVPSEDFDVLTVAISEPDPFAIATAPPIAIKVS